MDAQDIDIIAISNENVSTVMDMFSATTDTQIFSNEKQCEAVPLRNQILAWKKSNAITVFKAGVFDLFHNNHLLFLTHLRFIGAQLYLNENSKEPITEAKILEVACSDKVKIILTIDSDQQVHSTKSFTANKAYSPRPTLEWKNRVMMVAHQGLRHNGKAVAMVDAITSHGNNSCTAKDCPHQNDLRLAEYLEPEVLVLNKNSKYAYQQTQIPDSRVIIVDESELAFTDSMLNSVIKTSHIINRAKQ